MKGKIKKLRKIISLKAKKCRNKALLLKKCKTVQIMNLSEAKQHIELLEWEVKTLKETQLAFQNELIKEVQRINSMPPLKKGVKLLYLHT